MQYESPWFIAKDVCEVLGLSKHRDAVKRLDEDEGCPVVVDTLGGPQEMIAINESGLYHLILLSRKPEAKKFRKWVTSEVLPSIRKTGKYEVPVPMNDKVLRGMRAIADYLGRSVNSVYDQIHRGELPAVMERNAWTIREDDLQAWYERSVRHLAIAPIANPKSVVRWPGVEKPAEEVIDRTDEFVEWLGNFEFDIDARMATKEFDKRFARRFPNWHPARIELYRMVARVTGAVQRKMRKGYRTFRGLHLRYTGTPTNPLLKQILSDLPTVPDAGLKEISEILTKYTQA